MSQQRNHLPAVFVIANPQKPTVGQFGRGRQEQSCLWPAENLPPCAAPRSTPGASLRGVPEGFCGLHPWAGPAVKAAIRRSPSLAVAHLELLAESELDPTSENPSWILRDYSFEGANMSIFLNMQMRS